MQPKLSEEQRKAIGARLRARREELGLSLDQVGSQIGKSKEATNQTEWGERKGSESYMPIVSALGWEVDRPEDILVPDIQPAMPKWAETLLSTDLIEQSGRENIGKMVVRLQEIQGLSNVELSKRAGVSTDFIIKVRRGKNYGLGAFTAVIKALGIPSGRVEDLIFDYVQQEPGALVTDPQTINAEMPNHFRNRLPHVGAASAILRAYYDIKPSELLPYSPKVNSLTSEAVIRHFEGFNERGKKLTDNFVASLLVAYVNFDADQNQDKRLLQDNNTTPGLLKLSDIMNNLEAGDPILKDVVFANALNEACKELVDIAKRKEIESGKHNVKKSGKSVGSSHHSSQATLVGYDEPQELGSWASRCQEESGRPVSPDR